MAKNNNTNLVWMNTIVIILMIIVIGILAIQTWKLETELNKLPKRVCHTETKTERMDIEPYCKPDEKCYTFLGRQYYISRDISRDENIDCEEGISIYSSLRKLVNWGNETKVCLIKTSKEICEIK